MRKPRQKKKNGIIAEFKAFISRGNAVQLAVGVIIASAFTAIVNAVVKGVFNPLIALVFNSLGISTEGLGWVLNWWSKDANTVTDTTKNVISCFNGVYNKDFAIYFDLGTLINAILYFLVVAIVLFSVMKVFSTIKKRREKFEAAQLEKYYTEHPEERPKPEEPAPKQPTEVELLIEIRDQLTTLNKEQPKE